LRIEEAQRLLEFRELDRRGHLQLALAEARPAALRSLYYLPELAQELQNFVYFLLPVALPVQGQVFHIINDPQ
jgi:hypothetical protein